MEKKCETCGEKAHDFSKEEAFNCVPPKDTLIFGENVISREYREALFREFPMYTSEEVVGSFLGHNPYFPSESEWFENQNS